MKRFASVRFDGVLGANERDEVIRAYCSAGAAVTSWTASASRSYATLELARETPEVPDVLGTPDVPGAPEVPDVPGALAVLRVTPATLRGLAALEEVFAARGRPAGIFDTYREGAGIVIEFDPRRTPVALVFALIEAELGVGASRRIESLVPFDDATLTAFAAYLLGEPALDPSRLIEAYVEPLLSASGA